MKSATFCLIKEFAIYEGKDFFLGNSYVMRTIEELIADISSRAEEMDDTSDALIQVIDEVIDSLTRAELIYALIEYGWIEISNFMASTPIPMACCGFHFKQHLVKLIIIFEFINDLRDRPLTFDEFASQN